MKYKYLKLIAPSCANYKDKKMRFLFVEDMEKFVSNFLKSNNSFLAFKTSEVEYEICEQTKTVVTHELVFCDDKKYIISETKNTANKGDFVITKNAGLPICYVRSFKQAKQKYVFDVNCKRGVAKPKKEVRRFLQINQNIAFWTSWNQPMFLVAGGYLHITNNNFYAIQKYAFEHTYKRKK